MQESRYRLPDDLAGLLRSEWEKIIQEANFDQVDEAIVRDCIIWRNSQAYAGEGIGRSRSTVCRRMPRIIGRARAVAKKLRYI